jgi:hypothetical protein
MDLWASPAIVSMLRNAAERQPLPDAHFERAASFMKQDGMLVPDDHSG